MTKSPIHAVIGVRRHGDATFYVKRSPEMENYPGVWSLLSIQFKPFEIARPEKLGSSIRQLFARMSDERLGGVPIAVEKYLTSGSSDDNPMGVDVHLHLYEVSLGEEPRFNDRYYTEGAWLRPEEYEARCADEVCGLCLRLWADYAWLHGLADRPFAPNRQPTASK